VISKIKSGDSSFAGLEAHLNDPDILTKLQAAADNPYAPESLRLMNDILPSIRAGGSDTNFGPVQRAAGISKLYAMCQTYGLPSVYVSMNKYHEHYTF
jgi:hypothetical protein